MKAFFLQLIPRSLNVKTKTFSHKHTFKEEVIRSGEEEQNNVAKNTQKTLHCVSKLVEYGKKLGKKTKFVLYLERERKSIFGC